MGSALIPYTYALIPLLAIPVLYEAVRTLILMMLQLVSVLWMAHLHRQLRK